MVSVQEDYDGLIEGTDYKVTYKNNVNAGTATVTVTGIGNASGSKSLTFVISPASIGGEKLVLASRTATYNGKAQAPTVKTVGGKALKAGVDYDLEYESEYEYEYGNAVPKDAGTYRVRAVGKGNYEGRSDYAECTISKATIALPKAKAGLVYNGKAQVGVTGGEGYTVSGGSSKGAGSFTAKLTANKNHVFARGKATATVKWAIAKASQKITAKNATVTAKAKKAGKVKALAKNVTVNLKKKAKVSAKTKVAYKKANKAGGKKIVVNKKTGKVTLKKGLKAGTYKVKVKITTPKSANYKVAKARTITLTVKVR